MNAKHYTHLLRIKFKGDPGTYYNGYFNLESAKQDKEWQAKYLAKQGYEVESLTIVKANQ